MERKLPSMLNQERILREVYDDEQQSLRTILVQGFETSIELDHKDGDSVYTFSETVVVNANQEFLCKDYSKFCPYASGSILISPSESNDDWLEITVEAGKVYDLCAIRIKPNMICVLRS